MCERLIALRQRGGCCRTGDARVRLLILLVPVLWTGPFKGKQQHMGVKYSLYIFTL